MPMTFDDGIDALSQAECLALIGTGGVGRVAVSIGAVPAVFPVNYGVLDGDIVFRTGAGTKLDAAVRRSVVAFEVDDVDLGTHQGWSVLVVGMADEIRDRTVLARSELLAVRPWARGPRHHVVAVRPQVVTGRRIAPAQPG